ncbi:glycosyl hydrolases family 28-domain-containing protein [Zopfochytrium polystomum]|nr:glycosyl hydrolases family 28-domain-containing protein [Zopfochytrium polystomum]
MLPASSSPLRFLASAVSAAVALAASLAQQTTHAAPSPVAAAGSPCVINSVASAAACLSSTNILIQGPFTVPGDTTLDLSKLAAGTTVTVSGTVTWAKSSTFTKDNFLFMLGGSGITFDGTGGTFDGNGQLYWDGQGANGGVPKPKMFRVTTTGGSTIKGITIKNTPIHCFSVGGSDTTFSGITVDNSAGDAGGGHNTDAFDVSATGITIQNCMVHNQDDCLAVNSGGGITFTGNTCIGGHGISIGSIASGKTVDGVTVSDCTIADSDNGVRIKTIFQATGGFVKNVKYSNIKLSNIAKNGIVIEQDYENGSPTGTPTGGIPISGVTLTNIAGTMSGGKEVYILCAACTGFSFSGISITGGAAGSCTGVSPVPQGCPGGAAAGGAGGAVGAGGAGSSSSSSAVATKTTATTSKTTKAVTTLPAKTTTTTSAAPAPAPTTTASAVKATTTSAAAATTTTAAAAVGGSVCHVWSVVTTDGRSGHCTTKNNQNQACAAFGTTPFSVAVQALDPTGATSKVKLVDTAGVKANGEQEAATGGPTVAMFANGSGATVSLVSNGPC